MLESRSPFDPVVGSRVVYCPVAPHGLGLGSGNARTSALRTAVVSQPHVPGQPTTVVRLRVLEDGTEHLASYSPEPAQGCWSWPSSI